MSRPDVDPKRTGVKATMIPWAEPPLEVIDGRWYGPPGAFIESVGRDWLTNWILCCPGCGEMGSPRDGQSWQIVSGSFDDVSTLTLSPSIAKSCCGWHGHLKNGTFESV